MGFSTSCDACTGCDMTSKFGTKAAGIKTEAVLYLKDLKDFGRTHTNVQDCLHNAEKYLVQVLNRGNHGIETMDCLRYNMYYHRKSITIIDLPPTSYATQGHILRAFYVTYMQVKCLGDFSLNPQDDGFIMENETGSRSPCMRPRSNPPKMKNSNVVRSRLINNEAKWMVSNSAKLDSRTKQHTQSGVSTSDGSRDIAATKLWRKKKKKK